MFRDRGLADLRVCKAADSAVFSIDLMTAATPPTTLGGAQRVVDGGHLTRKALLWERGYVHELDPSKRSGRGGARDPVTRNGGG
jgi:hypothetical protein